jgi:LysM repeat protein
MGDMGDMGKTNVVIKKVELPEYTVKKGDTYYSLSKKFNISVKELEKINGNKKLLIGTKIKTGNN